MYSSCNQHIPFDQCYDILLEAIDYVLRKRVWENPESSLYQDPAAPDKAFHVALNRQRDIKLKSLNAQKRQVNFGTISIDAAHDEYNDAAEGLLNIGDMTSEGVMDNMILVDYIMTKTPEQVMLLDQVCFNSWSNLNNVITNTKKITEDDFEYYNSMYGMDKKQFTKSLRSIKMVSRNILMSELKKVLYTARREVYSG